MKINAGYEIDVVATDDNREIFEYINITTWQGEPVAIATDGLSLVVVPVEMEPGDVPGLLHYSHLAAARAAYDPEDIWPGEKLTIGLGADTVTFESGSQAPRCNAQEPLKFPDINAVVPRHAVADGTPPVFGIQPLLLSNVAQALGKRLVGIHRGSCHDRVVVSNLTQGDDLKPPFGILMLAVAEGLPTPQLGETASVA